MCPWCFVTPSCPCRRGGGPPSLTLGRALVAVARRSWRLGSPVVQRRSDVSLGHGANGRRPMIAKAIFAVLLMVCLLGIAACGDDDAEEGGTTAPRDVERISTIAGESSEPILIKTHLGHPSAQGKTSGEVLSGSTIGDSAFCARGKFTDGPVVIPSRLVLRSFRCPGGTLTITFTSTPPGVTQRSDWKVVNGLGRFEGLRGEGRMRGVLESGRRGGRETFTGTVTR